jgi:hypothetical protein
MIGDPRLPARFWAKVREDEAGCWLWTAYVNERGYAKYRISPRSVRAHRVAYEALVGVVPDGLELDHRCHVRHCVNPEHLRAVTHSQNLSNRLPRTHCKVGHELAGTNLFVTVTGSRTCVECRRAYFRGYCQRQRAA